MTVRRDLAHDALALGGWLEAGSGHEDAGLGQLLGELVHRREASSISGVGAMSILLSSVAIANTITRIVCLLVRADHFGVSSG
jgi:hypothetical protein